MAVHTICMAKLQMVFIIASAVAQANQCPGGGECPSDDMPKDVVSLLQTKLEMNAREVAQKRRSQPHVCILARTCGPQSHCKPSSGQLEAFLFSIKAQTYTNWELHLLNAEGGGEVFEDVVADLQDKRFSNGPSSREGFSINSYGFEATNFAMKQLLSGVSSQAACSYFLIANGDNLYGASFLEAGLPGMQSGLDLVGFNYVDRHSQTPMQDVAFKFGHIDMGAVLVSAEAVQGAQVQFQKKGERSEWSDAYWDFFSDIMRRKGSKGSKVYETTQLFHQ